MERFHWNISKFLSVREDLCSQLLYAKQFSIEEERLPYEEGWRPAAQPVTQKDMNHLIFNLIEANEHKLAEASEIGLGTVHAVQNAVTSLLPSYCVIM
jgi:hypothetical protein